MRALLLFIIIVCLLLAGCSRMTIAYNNADWYLQNKIEDYATFSSAQQKLISQEVDHYFEWHRRYVLPEYSDYLQSAIAALHEPLTAQSAANFRTRLRELYVITVAPMARSAAIVLSDLTPEQLTEFENNLQEQNTEMRDEFLSQSLDEYLTKRAKSAVNFIEDFSGNLSTSQKEQIFALSRALPITRSAWLESRASHQRKLISLLRDKRSASEIEHFLLTWIYEPQTLRSTKHQELLDNFMLASDQMAIAILQNLTPQQKRLIEKQLSNYINDFSKLATGEVASTQSIAKNESM